MTAGKTYIYGKHAIEEALINTPKAVEKVFMTSYFDDLKIQELIKKTGVSQVRLQKGKLPPSIDENVAHQGVMAAIRSGDITTSYKDFISDLQVSDETALVVLGEIQDVHNVGSIIRSAAAFGVAGVLIPEHNQAPITGGMVKVSSGMAFRIPLVTIGNINTTIRDLKDRGFRVYGLDGGATHTVTKEEYDMPTVFIIGNEAEGLREKTRELCDKLLSIPMHPRCESLNASVSSAVALYSWSSKHSKALK